MKGIILFLCVFLMVGAKTLSISELREFITPYAGEEEVWPKQILHIVTYLRDNNIKAFVPSKGFIKRSELYQRLVEGSYPIRARKEAQIHIILEGEKEDKFHKCDILSKKHGVIIANCPNSFSHIFHRP